MTVFIVIIFGLILGSFLNAFIHRLHSGQSIVNDRSRCVHCNHVLNHWDLVPIISFITLRGRCRYCGKPISWQYPLVEAAMSLILVLALLQFGISPQFFLILIFSSLLIVIGIFDLRHYLILDKLVFPGLALALIVNFLMDINFHQVIWQLSSFTVSGLLGALAISGFFAAQYFLSGGRWIGFGDVKFGLLLGVLLGLKLGLVSLFLAYLLGAVVGLGLIFSGRKNMGSRLPFGTFLSLASIIVLLYGEPIVTWYFRLIGI